MGVTTVRTMRKRREYSVGGCRVKSPKTAYLWFSNERRASLAKQHPDWDITAQSRELGRLWGLVKAADGPELKKYMRLQKKDKKRYIREKNKAIKESTEVVQPEQEQATPPALEDPAPAGEV